MMKIVKNKNWFPADSGVGSIGINVLQSFVANVPATLAVEVATSEGLATTGVTPGIEQLASIYLESVVTCRGIFQ